MRYFRKVALLALALVVLYGCFRLYFPTETARYRLSFSVQNGDKGIAVGTGVIQTDWDYNRPGPLRAFLQGATWGMRTTGEAVIVDLGEKGLLFALLKGSGRGGDPSILLPRALGFNGMSEMTPTTFEQRARVAQPVELRFDELPMLVRFRDVNDPKTVERVDPNDLAASFGPGVKLSRATIEITDGPVTVGIEKRLRWLAGMQTNIDGTSVTTSNNLPNRLNSSDFRKL